jgi:hypothetical protein
MIWSTHFKSFRLLHVDLFLQSAIEIGMRDVNRAKFKVLQSSQGQDNANSRIANSRSKCLLEVEARTLRIAFGNQPGLQGAVSIVFDIHEPSGADGTLPRREFDNLPSAIESVSLHLFLTCSVPQICIRAFLGLPVGCGLGSGCRTSLDEVKGIIRA